VPKTELHQTQKRKNLTVLLVLLVLMILLFAITMMKMTPAT
jgi:hypothetical protein